MSDVDPPDAMRDLKEARAAGQEATTTLMAGRVRWAVLGGAVFAGSVVAKLVEPESSYLISVVLVPVAAIAFVLSFSPRWGWLTGRRARLRGRAGMKVRALSFVTMLGALVLFLVVDKAGQSLLDESYPVVAGAAVGLVLALAGRTLEVPAGDMFGTILQVVLAPVLAGLVLRTFADRWITPVLPVLPLVSVGGIVLVVAGIVGANAEEVMATGALVAFAVVLHNGFGLLLGYLVGRIGGLPEAGRRAISVEVGMQNSGLAAALATTYFSPLAALPGALFSVWHNVSGALAASFWARRAPEGEGSAPAEQVWE